MSATEVPTASNEPLGREMTGWELRWSRFKRWLRKVGRKFPRLVWFGDEIDVLVTFSVDPLCPDDPMGSFMSGGLFEIEKHLRHMGIGFDTGQGGCGRDWEWDYSLCGPIRVTFKRRAKCPERRVADDHPKLKLVNDAG